MIEAMELYNVKRGCEGTASSSDGEDGGSGNEQDDKNRVEVAVKRRRVMDEVCDNGYTPVITFYFDRMVVI